MTFSKLCAPVVAGIILLSSTGSVLAHLGEVHPPGRHDYFPDVPIAELNDRIYFQDVLAVVGARDIEEIPDGSGRFLAMRGSNNVRITAPGRSHESAYLNAGSAEGTEVTEGSTSIALHPEFIVPGAPGYGKFYTTTIDRTFETETVDFQSDHPDMFSHYVLTEWTHDNPLAETFSGTSRELMRITQGTVFHNMNQVQFGPDGQLYVGIGQDKYPTQTDDLDSVYGKILRIDPLGTNSANGQYGIPEDNPFLETPGAAPELYATGFKNPWRITFDRDTGDMFAVDVGWNSAEEVDHVLPGADYGWPQKEGVLLTASEAIFDDPDPETGLTVAEANGFVEPLFTLDHSDTNAIIGGVLYRGERFPELQGKMIFGAWDKNDIYAGDPATGEMEIIVDGERLSEFMSGKNMTSINEDLDGELYILGGLTVVGLFAEPDFNRSGMIDNADINAVCDHFGSEGAKYDLNGDFTVDTADLEIALSFTDTMVYDVDGNGIVDGEDLIALEKALNSSYPQRVQSSGSRRSRTRQSDQPGSSRPPRARLTMPTITGEVHWSDGDFDCNGRLDNADLQVLQQIVHRVDQNVAASIPEPSSLAIMLIGVALLISRWPVAPMRSARR